ncbi:MAG TPA: hypothetical protein VHB73_00745 [Alphaproteobacteria bacterium]|nr:hypothetical protein [Alphaproteobacteria bacterium]
MTGALPNELQMLMEQMRTLTAVWKSVSDLEQRAWENLAKHVGSREKMLAEIGKGEIALRSSRSVYDSVGDLRAEFLDVSISGSRDDKISFLHRYVNEMPQHCEMLYRVAGALMDTMLDRMASEDPLREEVSKMRDDLLALKIAEPPVPKRGNVHYPQLHLRRLNRLKRT